MDWYDSSDSDQDVVNIAKDVGGWAVDVTVAVRNAPVTAATAAINSWTHGDRDSEAHLTVVCYGGVASDINPFADTWTAGSTIDTTYSKQRFTEETCGGLLAHET